MQRRGMLMLGFAGCAALACAPVVAAGWLLEHPERIGPLVSWLAGWPEGSVVLAGVEVGRRVTLTGLELHPPQRRSPDVYVAEGSLDWPAPWRLQDRVVHLGVVDARGVRVVARSQGGRGEPGEGGWTLSADRVAIHDGLYAAPATETLQEVAVDGVELEVQALSWQPRSRRIEGWGWARIEAMDLGAVEVSDVQVAELSLTGSDLELGPTRFRYGRTEAFADGRIAGIDRKPEVTLRVRLAGSRVEDAVEDATGRPSVLMGWLTSDVRVEAGGHLPEGGARISGWLQLSDAHVFAGDLRFLPRAFVDIAPWFRRGETGWVAVGNLRGEATFGRGWVELERLERVSDEHRTLQAWGELRDGQVDVTVRAVPRSGDARPGFGVRLTGPLGSTKLQVASRDHLRGAPE